jgi:hypothetical protein
MIEEITFRLSKGRLLLTEQANTYTVVSDETRLSRS